MHGLLDDGRIPVVSSVARGDATARSTTSTPTPRPRRSPSRSARRSWWSSPTSRGSTPTGRDERPTVDQPSITADELEALLPDAVQRHGAQDGGLPARRARRSAQAHVIDGRVPHALLLEVFTDEGIGTMVRPVTRAATA